MILDITPTELLLILTVYTAILGILIWILDKILPNTFEYGDPVVVKNLWLLYNGDVCTTEELKKKLEAKEEVIDAYGLMDTATISSDIVNGECQVKFVRPITIRDKEYLVAYVPVKYLYSII